MDAHVQTAQGPRALAAVLAGGLSTRMGTAKASVELCGRPLISYPLGAARDAGLPAVVMAKRASGLPALCAPIVYEPDRPRHPLCGIVAALRHARAPVLAIGCDMPFVSGELLAWLAHGGGEGTPAHALETTVAEAGGRVQPLPALYSPSDLPVLARALAARDSLRGALEALEPRVVGEDAIARFGRPERLCFSVNDAADLHRAREWMRACGAVPASSSSARTSSADGRSTRASRANAAIHSSLVTTRARPRVSG